MRKIHFILLFSFSCLPLINRGQSNDRIKYKADELFEFRENGQKIRKLTGKVVFTQENSTMYCDSSLYYVKSNVMLAFGQVKIVDDSVTITSKRLIYDGKNRTAKMREDVEYTRGKQRLFTEFLDYDMDAEIANYFNKGRLLDSTNVLNSEIGYFYAKENYALFWNNVELEAPDYILRSDTLRYDTKTKVAYTTGKTEIINDDGSVLHAKGGVFRTDEDQSEFIEGTIETEDYFLVGDELFFDNLKQYYVAEGNVKLIAKDRDVILYGNYGYTDKKKQISKIYGEALMKRKLEKDTFYLAADTLVSVESEYDSAKRILAYNQVKMWKPNLQGVADSASYFLSDSLLYLYRDPVIWNLENQISGDTIIMEITETELKNMTLLQNSFLISKDTIKNFNQIKGRTMNAFFIDSRIVKINVNGNGEAIYYVLDDTDSLNTTMMGMNRILCSNLTIRFKNQKPDNISFYTKPDAKFIPPHELTAEVQFLKGFAWRGNERPTLKEVLYQTGEIKNSDPPVEPDQPPPPSSIKIDREGFSDKKMQLLKKPKGIKE